MHRPDICDTLVGEEEERPGPFPRPKVSLFKEQRGRKSCAVGGEAALQACGYPLYAVWLGEGSKSR